MLVVFMDDATGRCVAGSWEIPTSIAGEIVLSTLASMCPFGMVVGFVKFGMSVQVEVI